MTASAPRRVLLVEDNGMIAMDVQEMLEELGVESVLLAGSVAQARPVLDGPPIDFAILDFQLGDETSLPIALALQERGVRFVFASGYGENVALPPAVAGVPFLGKPFLISELEALLQATR